MQVPINYLQRVLTNDVSSDFAEVHAHCSNRGMEICSATSACFWMSCTRIALLNSVNDMLCCVVLWWLGVWRAAIMRHDEWLWVMITDYQDFTRGALVASLRAEDASKAQLLRIERVSKLGARSKARAHDRCISSRRCATPNSSRSSRAAFLLSVSLFFRVGLFTPRVILLYPTCFRSWNLLYHLLAE